MNVIHLQKAFAFIAKGLVEKEKLLKNAPNRYPYSRDLQRGINMFLAACLELGGIGESVFKYADESSFLSHYICKPICGWFDDWNKDVLENIKIREQPFMHMVPLRLSVGKQSFIRLQKSVLSF